MSETIDKLIINSPYLVPKKHWLYDRDNRSFSIESGRRPAGYVVATPNSQSFDDPGIFVPIDLVNKIRTRVDAWREANYPGVTGITKRLLDHWQDPEERKDRRFFFCQLEAIETIIWLTESPASAACSLAIRAAVIWEFGPSGTLTSKVEPDPNVIVYIAIMLLLHPVLVHPVLVYYLAV